MAMNPRLLRPTANDSPASIPGLALWLDASASDALYTTDAGPVTAVSSPLDISGCALWLDASDAGSLTLNGNTASEWRDLSGNARHFSQATPANQPDANSRTQNGRRVLDFSGAQVMAGNAASKSIARNIGNATVFVVANSDTFTTNTWFLASRNGSAVQGRITVSFNLGLNNTVAGGRRTDADSFAFAGYTPSVDDLSAVSVHTGVFNFANSDAFIFRNGSSRATNTSFHTDGNTSDTDSDGVFLGALGDLSNALDGVIAEVIVYNTALSTSDRARVEAYLAAKWGISGVHAPAVTASDPVGYWRDRSGNGRHATQSTAASRPVVTTAAGKRAIVGDGGDALAITTTPSFIDGSHTLFLAMESDANVNRIPFYVGRAADVDNYSVLRGGSSVAGAFNSGIGSLAVSVATSGGLLATIRRESGVGQSLAIQGAAVASSAGGLDPSSTAIISVVGRQRASGTVSAGDLADIYEIIAYSRALSTAERRKVEVYLARRWGITLAPQVSNAEAQDWISRVYAAGSTVSQPVANAVSAFVDGCQADGIWDAMKSVVLLAGADTLAGALAPLKGTAPTSYNFASGDYSKTSGLKGNGSSYLDSNRAGTADPQDNFHHAVYVSSFTAGTQAFIGSGGGGETGATNIGATTSFFHHNRNASGDTTAFSSVSGFIGQARTASASYAFRANGSTSSISRASTSNFNASILVFARNIATGPQLLSSSRLSLYSIGEAVDLALLDARVSTLMTAIGVS